MPGEDAHLGRAAAGGLVVCPTPIGNLEDVTLRVLAVLGSAAVVACEDTRHTRVLLRRHGIVPARLLSYHEHNERERAAELVARMRAGDTVALVSDAGTPLISDPGFELVRATLAAGLPVQALPGPSAAVTALVAAGLPAERWRFVGFLPRRRAELERVLLGSPETLVAFESPRRLASTLAALAAHDPRRRVAVCRELTKLHEEVRRGGAAELAAHYEGHPPRGEVVLVLEGGPPAEAGVVAAVGALRGLVDAGARARPAAAVVARLTGSSANELYRELLKDNQ
jgi:16S rRNA (cytidine1402-2'-O)-methyltransferase